MKQFIRVYRYQKLGRGRYKNTYKFTEIGYDKLQQYEKRYKISDDDQGPVSRCRVCRNFIVWAKNENGKKVPYIAEHSKFGFLFDRSTIHPRVCHELNNTLLGEIDPVDDDDSSQLRIEEMMYGEYE